ncbi:MAG TPA: NAD-dependent epimerase/dehydratase family protein [Myxococcales bacterium]|jgi:UDP-glucose 4-epimerase|nr:NAD-dependent epimerase/dehydratase family protein [Myxococcales bacterium]
MRVLIPGIAGLLARKVAQRLLGGGHEVIGIDPRGWPGAPKEIELHAIDIRKRAAGEVFRKRRPQAVVHMATISALTADAEERYRINLGGTRAVFEYCAAHGVEQLVFVGRHTYYGAGPDAPLYHTESEPPQELGSYPELADLVAADLYAANALWRLPALQTAVLRICYTLGPSGHGTLASFLRGRFVPMVLGFDPLFQFIHEDDAADAIVAALSSKLRGIFNVAGPQPLPLGLIAREAGRRALPFPEALLAVLLGRAGLPRLSRGALAHIKYPIVVDASLFRRETGFAHRFDELVTVQTFADGFPAGGRSSPVPPLG